MAADHPRGPRSTDRPRVTVTAFGPFCDVKVNPTDVLLRTFLEKYGLIDSDMSKDTSTKGDGEGGSESLLDLCCKTRKKKLSHLLSLVELSCHRLEVSCEAATDFIERNIAVVPEGVRADQGVCDATDAARHVADSRSLSGPETKRTKSSVEHLKNCGFDEKKVIGNSEYKLTDLSSTMGSGGAESSGSRGADLCIHFGVYMGSDLWNLECRGLNWAELGSVPDVRGEHRTGRILPAPAPAEIYSRVDVLRLLGRFTDDDMAHKIKISAFAGTYLCNYLFFKSLFYNAGNSIFIHVPDLKTMFVDEQLEYFERAMEFLLEEVTSRKK